jgi:hypothetical protein
MFAIRALFVRDAFAALGQIWAKCHFVSIGRIVAENIWSSRYTVQTGLIAQSANACLSRLSRAGGPWDGRFALVCRYYHLVVVVGQCLCVRCP